MKQPSRRAKIITSCCLFATVSFLYRAQYILDSTQSTTLNVGSIDTRVHEKLWSDLPPHAQSAASTLQYTKETWDASADSPLQSQPWNSLSKEEKIAAVQLGLDVDWSRDDGYDDLHWDELDDGVRVEAEKLG